MFSVIEQCYAALEEEGFVPLLLEIRLMGSCIPNGFILAEYAQKIGFKVDKIEVDDTLLLVPSNRSTKEYGKYLRESVVCLKINNQIIVENLPENISLEVHILCASKSKHIYALVL